MRLPFARVLLCWVYRNVTKDKEYIAYILQIHLKTNTLGLNCCVFLSFVLRFILSCQMYCIWMNNASHHRGTIIFTPHGEPCYIPQPPFQPTDLKLSRPISTLS